MLTKSRWMLDGIQWKVTEGISSETIGVHHTYIFQQTAIHPSWLLSYTHQVVWVKQRLGTLTIVWFMAENNSMICRGTDKYMPDVMVTPAFSIRTIVRIWPIVILDCIMYIRDSATKPRYNHSKHYLFPFIIVYQLLKIFLTIPVHIAILSP